MNTPAHLLFGLAVFGRADRPKVTAAAVAGAFAPDASLYIMTGVSIWGLGIPAERVFRELYYSDAWQLVFAIDNSFILWGIAFLLALRARALWAVAFTGAALLHLAFDFPLHTHDARAHFWPITMWRFEGPISYWDHGAHAGIVGPIVAAMCLGATLYVWRAHQSLWPKLLAVLLLAGEFASSGVWRFVF